MESARTNICLRPVGLAALRSVFEGSFDPSASLGAAARTGSLLRMTYGERKREEVNALGQLLSSESGQMDRTIRNSGEHSPHGKSQHLSPLHRSHRGGV